MVGGSQVEKNKNKNKNKKIEVHPSSKHGDESRVIFEQMRTRQVREGDMFVERGEHGGW